MQTNAEDKSIAVALQAGIDPHTKLNIEEVFLLYAAFCGDLERTAHSAGCRPQDVLRLADQEGWMEKIRGLIELKKSERPGDVERALNRAMNFVQAHRLRLLIAKVVKHWEEKAVIDVASVCYDSKTTTIAGETVETVKATTRPLTDLAAAMEKVHAMSYMALGDTATDRSRDSASKSDGVPVVDIHAQISEHMSKVRASATPRALLTQEQLDATDAKRTMDKV